MKKKKTGINKEAQVANVTEVRNDLQSLYPHLTEKPVDNACNASNATIKGQGRAAKRTSSSNRSSRRSNVDYKESDDDSDTVVIGSKKVKIDLDFTPQKYEKVKQELDIQKNAVKRVLGLNTKLRENLQTSEERNNLLETAMQEKENECDNLRKQIRMWTSLKCFFFFSLGQF